MSEADCLPNQWYEMRLKARLPQLSLYSHGIPPAYLLELEVSGSTTTTLGPFQESRGRRTGNCHVYIGVRLTVDPEDQKVCSKSWVILTRVWIHELRF